MDIIGGTLAPCPCQVRDQTALQNRRQSYVGITSRLPNWQWQTTVDEDSDARVRFPEKTTSRQAEKPGGINRISGFARYNVTISDHQAGLGQPAKTNFSAFRENLRTIRTRRDKKYRRNPGAIGSTKPHKMPLGFHEASKKSSKRIQPSHLHGSNCPRC